MTTCPARGEGVKVCCEKDCTEKGTVNAVLTPSMYAIAENDGRLIKRNISMCKKHYEQFLQEILAGAHWLTVANITLQL